MACAVAIQDVWNRGYMSLQQLERKLSNIEGYNSEYLNFD